MGARGRHSAAGLSMSLVAEGPRPTPPVDLPADQLDVWNRTVDGLPADWFRSEQLDLLVMYCRHVARGRLIAEQLDAWDRVPLDRTNRQAYIALLAEEREQTKAAGSLATKMRLTQQATIDPQKTKGRDRSVKLWQDNAA